MPFAVVEPGLHGHDLAARDDRRVHLAERHPQQVEDADAGAGRDRLNPQPKVAGEDREERQHDDQRTDQQHQPQRVAAKHAVVLSEARSVDRWNNGRESSIMNVSPQELPGEFARPSSFYAAGQHHL